MKTAFKQNLKVKKKWLKVAQEIIRRKGCWLDDGDDDGKSIGKLIDFNWVCLSFIYSDLNLRFIWSRESKK